MRLIFRFAQATSPVPALPAVAFLSSAGPLSAQPGCTPSISGRAYSSTTAINVQAGAQNGTTVAASPYPGTITVPNTVTGNVTGVRVELTGVKGGVKPSHWGGVRRSQ
jgi:hypothetical protein